MYYGQLENRELRSALDRKERTKRCSAKRFMSFLDFLDTRPVNKQVHS